MRAGRQDSCEGSLLTLATVGHRAQPPGASVNPRAACLRQGVKDRAKVVAQHGTREKRVPGVTESQPNATTHC